MDNCEKLILSVLRASIKNEKLNFDDEIRIDWNRLIRIAENHKISSLVYYKLSKNAINIIDKQLLDSWKKKVILSNIFQINNEIQMTKVLSEFKKNKLDVIILKGLYLRQLYPKPELRTMGDGDILVKRSDYLKAKDVLINMGYEYSGKNSIHGIFRKSGVLEIELHTNLIDRSLMSMDVKNFENNIWMNTEKIIFNGVEINILGKEDFLLHLGFHMAIHSKYRGFGLRQLYDFAILVNKNKELIDWDKFNKKADEYGIFKFLQGIFIIINNEFGVSVDNAQIENNKIRSRDVKLLLKDIMISGIYGQMDLRAYLHLLYEKDNYYNGDEKICIKILKVMFPNIKTISTKYYYAKKCSLLIPIAWIHRLIYVIFMKYGFINLMCNMKYHLKFSIMKKNIIEIFELPN